MRCRDAWGGIYRGTGMGGSQQEAITRIARAGPSDTSERTVDARGGRTARGSRSISGGRWRGGAREGFCLVSF